ncbi:hypothetical protein FI667_g14575, partial [Globisporangium splendens]
MRPRTKSVVNVHEYFSQDDGESDQEEDEDEDWMQLAAQYKPLKRTGSFTKAAKSSKRERTSTLDSWEGTDVEDEDDDDDERNERVRTCSHDRRISFEKDVDIVTIPARSSFDAEYKRRVWYSSEEFSRMRQLD